MTRVQSSSAELKDPPDVEAPRRNAIYIYFVCNGTSCRTDQSLRSHTVPTRPQILSRFSHRPSMAKRREKNQLDATECFIVIIICSTCFGHSYAHHQEIETILVLLPHMVCNALVAGGRLLGVEIACCSTPNSRPPATKILSTICGNNTSIVHC